MHDELIMSDLYWTIAAIVAVTFIFAPLAMWLYKQER
jgi:hypothetical protein